MMAICPHCFGFVSDTPRWTGRGRRRAHRRKAIAGFGLEAGLLALVLTENALWVISAGVIAALAASVAWLE
jgi:hypothetical protein